MARKPASESALDRFLRYVRIDTQSQEEVETVPSTWKQLHFARLLRDELRAMGARAQVDDHGYVYARIPSTLPAGHPARGRVPILGLLAHLDTAPAASGSGVRPVVRTYTGGDVELGSGVVLRARENPELRKNRGKRIVTADGRTLLGADDKAGIAVVMTLAEELLRGGGAIPHGELRICFTPDEEVGNGTKYLDRAAFGAEVAYTVDGDAAGVLNRETFSADQAVVTVHGRSIHPGTAKGRLVNAVRVLADVVARLPRDVAPETTEGREPYLHPYAAEGTVARATLRISLRDFDTGGLARQRRLLQGILREVRRLHPKARVELAVKESYRNMREGLERDPRVTAALEEATRRAGLTPVWIPIRGGTDGSHLTAMGIPTPNVFTGGQSFHGPTEWLSVEGLEKSLETVRHLLGVWVELGARARAAGGRARPARPRAPRSARAGRPAAGGT